MNANLFRRLMAAFYDLLLVIAILFVATALVLIANGGDAVNQEHDYYWLYLIYLAAISFTYYAWFWTHGGQTPGMKTWHMRLYRSAGIDLKVATLYSLAALLSWAVFGLGFIIALFHPQRRTLHDILLRCDMQDLR